MLKTSTVTKLRHVEELLRTAHEAIFAAITDDPEFAAVGVEHPKDSDVTLLVTAMVGINDAGKQLEELIKKYD